MPHAFYLLTQSHHFTPLLCALTISHCSYHCTIKFICSNIFSVVLPSLSDVWFPIQAGSGIKEVPLINPQVVYIESFEL